MENNGDEDNAGGPVYKAVEVEHFSKIFFEDSHYGVEPEEGEGQESEDGENIDH